MLCFVAIMVSSFETKAQEAAAEQTQTPTTEVSTEQQKMIEARRQRRMQKFAASHSVKIVGSKTNVELYKTPIFFWSNPERESVGGAVYMWVQKGRPVATIGLWTYKDTKDSYEYQSLSEQPLSVYRGGVVQWSPKTAGLKFKPLPGALPPAKSKARRLTQMRAIARKRFESSVKSGGKDEPLRLLPQPIYRYGELPTDVEDGAVFSFATGTDPETLLIMEARTVGKTNRQWFYAFGNQTSASVTGKLDGGVIWSHEMGGDDFKLTLYRDE